MSCSEGQNSVPLVRLKPAIPHSRVKHSLTEPLHSTVPLLFITLCFGSIGMDCVIHELCYNRVILQRNYRKIAIYGHLYHHLWAFSYNSSVKFHAKSLGATTCPCYTCIQICVIMRCVINLFKGTSLFMYPFI